MFLSAQPRTEGQEGGEGHLQLAAHKYLDLSFI